MQLLRTAPMERAPRAFSQVRGEDAQCAQQLEAFQVRVL